jgi:hypothetical protein
VVNLIGIWCCANSPCCSPPSWWPGGRDPPYGRDRLDEDAEEIDALRVMGLDPIEVLIVPRLLALVIALPVLSFLSAMASLFGGLLVAWIYADISPTSFWRGCARR